MSKMKFRKRRKKDVYEILSEVAAVCMVIGILQMAGAEGTVKAAGTEHMVYFRTGRSGSRMFELSVLPRDAH